MKLNEKSICTLKSVQESSKLVSFQTETFFKALAYSSKKGENITSTKSDNLVSGVYFLDFI